MSEDLKKILEIGSAFKLGERRYIKCPRCKGQLFISKSAYDGDIFAKCDNHSNCIIVVHNKEVKF